MQLMSLTRQKSYSTCNVGLQSACCRLLQMLLEREQMQVHLWRYPRPALQSTRLAPSRFSRGTTTLDSVFREPQHALPNIIKSRGLTRWPLKSSFSCWICWTLKQNEIPSSRCWRYALANTHMIALLASDCCLKTCRGVFSTFNRDWLNRMNASHVSGRSREDARCAKLPAPWP